MYYDSFCYTTMAGWCTYEVRMSWMAVDYSMDRVPCWCKLGSWRYSQSLSRDLRSARWFPSCWWCSHRPSRASCGRGSHRGWSLPGGGPWQEDPRSAWHWWRWSRWRWSSEELRWGLGERENMHTSHPTPHWHRANTQWLGRGRVAIMYWQGVEWRVSLMTIVQVYMPFSPEVPHEIRQCYRLRLLRN